MWWWELTTTPWWITSTGRPKSIPPHCWNWRRTCGIGPQSTHWLSTSRVWRIGVLTWCPGAAPSWTSGTGLDMVRESRGGSVCHSPQHPLFTFQEHVTVCTTEVCKVSVRMDIWIQPRNHERLTWPRFSWQMQHWVLSLHLHKTRWTSWQAGTKHFNSA